ncbi:hypothetical protein KIPB_001792 [Kipferlia bialata]|uniref:Uncharacterized protein n=1 Tax=Kipferlia bialata TaxID=797122 RepID=A0A9K3CQH1_9EUKA|nr:hypothetical protein KIPB_001792 [Kipferlia bialata]|eukprot:g1792.t1
MSLHAFLSARVPDSGYTQALQKAYDTYRSRCGSGVEAHYHACAQYEWCPTLVEVMETGEKGLSLKHHAMGDQGVRDLASTLQHMPQLTHLYLAHNDIGPQGAQALAAALPALTSLQYVDLKGNPIGEEGADAIRAAMPEGCSLGPYM